MRNDSVPEGGSHERTFLTVSLQAEADGNGDVLTMTAVQPSGGATPNQTTAYIYGIGSTIGTDLFSNDLVLKIENPDPSTGSASTSIANDKSFTYDRQGEQITMADQNGNTHTYNFDVLARITADIITTLGSGVDGAIRRLGFSFNDAGLPYQQTSYSNTSGTTVINQVEDAYNGYGQLITQYQEHSGAVNTNTSLKVRYFYSQPTGANYSRLIGMMYPNGRVIDYGYTADASGIVSISSSGTTATATLAGGGHLNVGDTIVIAGAATSQYDGTFTITAISGATFTFNLAASYTGSESSSDINVTDVSFDPLDNAISRIGCIVDHGGSSADFLQRYFYLGLSQIVLMDDMAGGPALDYRNTGQGSVITDGGDKYTGLDRFGRVIDQYWHAGSTTYDRFQYGYDRDSNVLYKNNLVNSASSELYSPSNGTAPNSQYDSLNRVTGFMRGTLSSSGSNGSALDTVSTASATQSWSLDALGNWSSFTTGGSTQTRSFNAQDEISSISGTTTTPAFDNNGNMTEDEQNHKYVFDAWNRIVTVKNAGTNAVQESNAYDALGQRISQTVGSTATDLLYGTHPPVIGGVNPQDVNVIEERQSGTVTSQYVWGVGYVNALVLRDDNSVSGDLGITGSGLGERIYAFQDANWNVTALDKVGVGIAERFLYDAYGTPTVLTSAWGSTTDSYSWLYKFQGGRQDATSNLVHFGTNGGRDYSTTLGRFAQKDSAGYVDGANLYQAFLGAPISKVDPQGHDATDPGDTSTTGDTGDHGNPELTRQIGAAIGGVIGAIGGLIFPPAEAILPILGAMAGDLIGDSLAGTGGTDSTGTTDSSSRSSSYTKTTDTTIIQGPVKVTQPNNGPTIDVGPGGSYYNNKTTETYQQSSATTRTSAPASTPPTSSWEDKWIYWFGWMTPDNGNSGVPDLVK